MESVRLDPGRYVVVRDADLVLVVQEGYFGVPLMERLVEDVQAAFEAAHVQHESCVCVADTSRMNGASLLARVKFERFARHSSKLVRRTAIVTNSLLARGLASAGDFAPSFPYRFVGTREEALEAVGRSRQSAPVLEILVQQGQWKHGEVPSP